MNLQIFDRIFRLIKADDSLFNDNLYKKFIAISAVFLLLFNIFIIPVSSDSIKNKELSSIDSNGSKINDLEFNLKLRMLYRLVRSPALSLGIIKNDSIAWYDSFGCTNFHSLKKVTKDTIFMLSSVTKTITTTALLQLYEKGLVDLDANVSKYLPFDLKNPHYPNINITLRMLLYHRSSIRDNFLSGARQAIDTLIENPFQYTTEQLLKEMLIPGGKLSNPENWDDSPPDTNSYYTNIGFIVVGCVIEIVSGQTIEDYCQEHIFKPLDMKNTSYHPENLDHDNIARPYIRPFLIPIPFPSIDHKCFAAMGGVRTSVEDLSHFLIAHMNNGTYKGVRILKNETVELMHTILYPQVSNNNLNLHKRSYGMGWFSENWFGDETEGHGGMQPGGIAYMVFNKTNKIGIIITSNDMDVLEFFKVKFTVRFFFFRQLGELLLEKGKTL